MMPAAEFCLVEQILPDGPGHPFGAVMVDHFEKRKTPLRSVLSYPTLEAQEERFLTAGWRSASARTLWDIWADDDFLSSPERERLNEIEPFDEVCDSPHGGWSRVSGCVGVFPAGLVGNPY